MDGGTYICNQTLVGWLFYTFWTVSYDFGVRYFDINVDS